MGSIALGLGSLEPPSPATGTWVGGERTCHLRAGRASLPSPPSRPHPVLAEQGQQLAARPSTSLLQADGELGRDSPASLTWPLPQRRVEP